MTIDFNINRAFEKVLTTDRQIIDLVGGRGRGGSYFGTDYFLFLLVSSDYFRGCLLRQVFYDIRDSLFRDIKDRISEHGLEFSKRFKINESEMRISYHTGRKNEKGTEIVNEIISKGFVTSSNRTAKLKSLAGFTHVLIEEANEINEYQFDQLLLSLRTKKVKHIQVLRIFNPPPKRHWIWRDYNLVNSEYQGYYRYTPKTDSGVEMCFSTYLDNIKNLNSAYIARLEKLQERPDIYYTIVKGLIGEGNVGRIYTHFQHVSNSEFDNIDSRSVYVIDFGFSEDPTALIQVKWRDNRLYVREHLYQSGLDDLTIAKRMIDLGITYRDTVIADYGNGGDVRIHNLRTGGGGAWDNIEGYPELKKGFSVYYAKKGAGSIAAGINMVKSYDVYVTEDSVNAWSEVQDYCWAISRDSEILDVPIDKFNHIMDCIRYFVLYKSAHRI
ncbi:MAG: phage terminase large subunit [Prevotellaceae bacterium]|jgi:phage terminase large subunit|nr:phage terminase large subunit [Prevotellaceae bacterium]